MDNTRTGGAATGDKDVGIWGGANIIGEYRKAGLLDEMKIHLIPVLVGDGIRLFDDLGGRRIELKRTSTDDTRGRDPRSIRRGEMTRMIRDEKSRRQGATP